VADDIAGLTDLAVHLIGSRADARDGVPADAAATSG
jgi:hypothetical protein